MECVNLDVPKVYGQRLYLKYDEIVEKEKMEPEILCMMEAGCGSTLFD